MIPELAILGLGSRSTAHLLKELNDAFARKYGVDHTLPLLLYNVDFASINRELPEGSDYLNQQLQDYCKAIWSIGAKQLVLANITLLKFLDKVDTPLEILHPLRLAAEYCRKHSIGTMIAFGTRHEGAFEYQRIYLEELGINLTRPNIADMDFLDQLRLQIYEGTETVAATEKFELMVNKYEVINKVMLACSEFSILQIKRKNTIDCMDLLVNVIV